MFKQPHLEAVKGKKKKIIRFCDSLEINCTCQMLNI